MIDYNLGVSPMASYEIKKVDLDYFTEEWEIQLLQSFLIWIIKRVV